MNFPFTPLMKQYAKQWPQAVSTDHHRRQVGLSTGRLWLSSTGPWPVILLILSLAEFPLTKPHQMSVVQPTGRRLARRLTLPRQCLDSLVSFLWALLRNPLEVVPGRFQH